MDTAGIVCVETAPYPRYFHTVSTVDTVDTRMIHLRISGF